jgi:hypothetical protein
VSAPIGPGDFVECVDASPSATNGRPAPFSLGGVYTVAELLPPDVLGDAGVRLREVPVTEQQRVLGTGWRASRFRPIYTRKQSLITDLLTKAPQEKEPAHV